MSARTEGNDFLIEERLHELDPGLHKRVTESIFVLQKLLSDYLVLFPEFTDHAETHSITVIDNCNQLIGRRDIERLNADEIYVLLMAGYLHDVGMGISEKDYDEFSSQIDISSRMSDWKERDRAEVIRAFHNDFSACFIKKYAQLFDFPSELHEFAVMQVARGHRKADLYDEKEYPAGLILENGNSVALPFLAAILRLGDELNVARDRTLKLTARCEKASTQKQQLENDKHEAIKQARICYDRIELDVETDDIVVMAAVSNLAIKLQKTLEYCRHVVEDRTDHVITQKKVVVLGA